MGKTTIAVLCIYFTTGIQTIDASISLGSCSLSCSENENLPNDLVSSGFGAQGKPGKRGPVGPKGDQGIKGNRGIQGLTGDSCDCSRYDDLITEMERMQAELNDLKKSRIATQNVSITIFNVSDSLKQTQLRLNSVVSFIGLYKASNNYAYKLYTGKKTYQSARKQCKTFGGDLIVKGLRDSDVYSQLVQAGIIVQPSSGNEIWIGMNDILVEGAWEWLDGGRTNPSVIQWNVAEPNNYDNNEDCAAINSISSTNATINDITCSELRPYICEFFGF